MKRTVHKISALLLVLVMMAAFCLPSAFAGTGTGQEQLDRLRDLDYLLTELYLYGVENYPLPESLASRLEADPALYDKIAAAMFNRLDPYSFYMSEEEYNEAFPVGRQYIGIGIALDTDAAVGVYIEQLVSGSPAQKEGLLPGDLIVEVDGVDVSGFTWEMGSDVLQGDSGIVAELTVIRQGTSEPLHFSIARQALSLPNVTAANLGDGVGYIRIDRFASVWDHIDFFNYYNEFPYEGVRSVIIDLRNNPGGSVEVVANMLGVFFGEKDLPLFQLEYASFDPEVFSAAGGSIWTPNALVVLVNEYSASSAEIFAGVLQAQGKAVTLGEKTYGKARGQFHIPLDDDSVAIITSSRIVIDKLPDYHETGITPTRVVPLEKISYPIPGLAPLSLTTGVYRTSTQRVLALTERLSVLGYYNAEPSAVFDGYARHALQNFQRAAGLPLTRYADIATLQALDEAVAALAATEIYWDSQMEAAHEIAREAAEKPLSGTLPKRDFSFLLRLPDTAARAAARAA